MCGEIIKIVINSINHHFWLLLRLCYFCSLTQDSEIKCYRGKFWKLIIEDLIITAEKYKKQIKQ